jgi:hypothetical protein
MTPPKVLLPWPRPMLCAMGVELMTGSSRVPQGDIGHLLPSPVRQTLDPTQVYPEHETNNKLMSKPKNFAVKHTTHRSRPYDLLVQILARCLVLHDNSLQPGKLAHHMVRKMPLHYVVANEREFSPP